MYQFTDKYFSLSQTNFVIAEKNRGSGQPHFTLWCFVSVLSDTVIKGEKGNQLETSRLTSEEVLVLDLFPLHLTFLKGVQVTISLPVKNLMVLL